MKKICLLIPCYNEEEGIGTVLENIPHAQMHALGYEVNPIVIDNNSQDKTSQIAASKGAAVLSELKKGKGCAMLTGFKAVPIDTSIVVMIDGDASYNIKELPRLIEPIDSGFGEVIIGTRLNGKILHNSMPGFNRIGNWFFTFLTRSLYKTNITDVCSGFFAWKKYVVDNLVHEIESTGFSLEIEMIIKMAKLNFQVYSVPISYHERNGATNLHPIKDGSKILFEAFRHLLWKPKQVVIKELPEPVLPDVIKQKA